MPRTRVMLATPLSVPSATFAWHAWNILQHEVHGPLSVYFFSSIRRNVCNIQVNLFFQKMDTQTKNMNFMLRNVSGMQSKGCPPSLRHWEQIKGSNTKCISIIYYFFDEGFCSFYLFIIYLNISLNEKKSMWKYWSLKNIYIII